MTRGYTDAPIWTWKCDRCGRETRDLAREQGDLPTPEQMRDRGWFIAEKWGDLCPNCVQARSKPRSPYDQSHQNQKTKASPYCQRCGALMWLDKVETDVGLMHARCAEEALRAIQLSGATAPVPKAMPALAEDAPEPPKSEESER